MSNTREQLDLLVSTIPSPGHLIFKSDRDMQDFNERDFDRRLAFLQVEALVSIVEQLEILNGVDTRTTAG